MNTLETDLQALAAKHAASARGAILLRLVDILAGAQAIQVPRAAATSSAQPRFINLGADGRPTDGDHVAVYQTATGLIWTAAPLGGGKEMDHADAMQAPRDIDLLGQKDWRGPDIHELLSIIDYERCDPAVDPKHFKGPYGYTWASTLAKAPAGCAWFVHLYGGDSGRNHQDGRYRGLAVRAGQQLDLGLGR